MRKLFFLSLVICILCTTCSYAETPSTLNDEKNLEVLTSQPLGRYPRWKKALDSQERLWLAYYRADEKLIVRRPDGSEISLNPVDRPNSLSGLAVHPSNDSVGILWRDKLPSKGLYYLPEISTEGNALQPLIIDQETEPLTRFKVAKDKGETYFLWYGEKSNPGEKRYQLYFRYLGEDGKTLSDTEMLMPGIYPAWIVDDKQIAVFSWVPGSKEKKDVMAMRLFDREKKEFGPVTKIVDAPPIGPFFFTLKSGERWFLFWFGHYGQDGRDYLIEGVYSDDKGQNWKRFALDELRGLDLSDIQTAADGKGNILIGLSGRKAGPRNDVYFIHSADNGTTWSSPYRPRAEAIRNTKADYPSVAFGSEPGTAMIVWEDWRDIRANVYAAYSSDGGATWGEAMPIATAGKENVVLSFNSDNVVSVKDNQFYLIGRRFTDDALVDSNLVKYTLTPESLEKRSQREAKNNSKATDARLRERVNAYWEAMKSGDYDRSYSLLDPFFRARRPFEAYRPFMGKIKYHNFTVKSMDRQGNIAEVRIENEASVPEFELPSGKTYSVPEKKISSTETWVFVGGDWYREYFEEMAEARYTRY